MKKVIASILLPLLLVSGGISASAANNTAPIPRSDTLKIAEAELVVVGEEETSFKNDEEIDIYKLLKERNISGSFKYIDGAPVLEGDIVAIGKSVAIHPSTLKGSEKTIELKLPDVIIETDELYEDEEEVVVEGVVGSAIKVTIVTERPTADGVKKFSESSLTVTKQPVAKEVKKGTKPRPAPVVTSEPASGSGDRSTSTYTEVNNTPPPARAGSVVETAYQFIGVPYVYGGSTPSGFDCSGFTSYVYGLHGISLPRVSYSQAGVGVGVSLDNAQPGDLLILNGGGHVGIYIGNGQLIHSPRPGKSVEVTQLSYFSISSIRRL